MGIYESKYWLSDGIGMNRKERRSGIYYSFLPGTISDKEIMLHGDAIKALNQAEAALAILNRMADDSAITEPSARLILRSEALASSRIEGLEIPTHRLLEEEAVINSGIAHHATDKESALLGNITLMEDAVNASSLATQFTVEGISYSNFLLLQKTSEHDYGGNIRTSQNWIGGNRVNPIGAVYVPPDAAYVLNLLDDLVRFLNNKDYPPLLIAAIAHAQFETIHPYADGNGRTGRALIHAALKKGGLIHQIVPPISLIFAADKKRYLANLNAYRYEGDPKTEVAMNAINDWVEYFSNATLQACTMAQEFGENMSSPASIRPSLQHTLKGI
ncbi:MAG: Fic family protein [Eggerthellaceae bacterium]|nr:Fic family protein [Eggerthellaceae bacterium]MCH4221361.1 Fic family protein [Eggerthellaceae bacterium]